MFYTDKAYSERLDLLWEHHVSQYPHKRYSKAVHLYTKNGEVFAKVTDYEWAVEIVFLGSL